jgi:SAM-dependent methyltransferase
MESRLSKDRAYWDSLARHDPLWAVLSDPSKAGRHWRLTDFMTTGEREIALLAFQLEQLGFPMPTGAALDFGCGVGRLTQALARRFETVIGVDISSRMIALAERLNCYGARVRYVWNESEDLAAVPSGSVEFVYSSITLQHVSPKISVRYLEEFLRILRPGGLLVFQLPSHVRSAAELTTRPMPDAAYCAGIRLLHEAPTHAVQGCGVRVCLDVANSSQCEWRQPDVGSLRLGNHWLDAAGERLLLQDDARAVLPQMFAPGQHYPAELTITAPRAAGVYTAEFDLVHEGVTWFAHKGSPTLRCLVNVSPGTGQDVAPPLLLEECTVPEYNELAFSELLGAYTGGISLASDFPMYGVQQDVVVALMAKANGLLLHVEEDPRAGSEWQSFRYVVRRR